MHPILGLLMLLVIGAVIALRSEPASGCGLTPGRTAALRRPPRTGPITTAVPATVSGDGPRD